VRLAPPPVSVDPLPADWCPSEPLSPEIAVAEPDLSDTVPETDAEPESEPAPTADSDCGCGSTSPATVVIANGRRIPSRLIIARGRRLPDPGCGPI
jgi:hypothetical protein